MQKNPIVHLWVHMLSFASNQKENKEKPISLYHDDEKIIDMIIESAIINNYIDLADYYSHDEFSISEQAPQKHD